MPLDRAAAGCSLLRWLCSLSIGVLGDPSAATSPPTAMARPVRIHRARRACVFELCVNPLQRFIHNILHSISTDKVIAVIVYTVYPVYFKVYGCDGAWVEWEETPIPRRRGSCGNRYVYVYSM